MFHPLISYYNYKQSAVHLDKRLYLFDMVDISEYKVGVIQSLEACGNPKANKGLKACKIDIGSSVITVVTSAPNVREGSRIAVCPVGSHFLNDEGEETKVEKTTVGGVVSEGMLCDARMLGWSANAGIAVQMPESLEVGASPPATKPRPTEATSDLPESKVEGLFEKKLSKEEKKKLAEEKRKAKKAAKEAKKTAEGD